MSHDSVELEKVVLCGRPWVLAAVCTGLLMSAFNTTMVNIALPSIGSDLHLSDRSLTQILSAYVAAFGGFMLLAGRLGDALGYRCMFVVGTGVFAIASLGCGLATSAHTIIIWRCVQGIAGAIICVMALSLAVSLYVQQTHRTKVLGLCTFVSATGGSVGLVIGGILVSTLNWRWIFLLNVPLSAMCAIGVALLTRHGLVRRRELDTRGTAVAFALMVAITYGIGKGSQAVIAVAGLLLVASVSRVSKMRSAAPRDFARISQFAFLNAVAALLAVSALTWNFVSALYLQRVLAFSAMQVGLAFLPATIATAAVSLLIAPWLVARLGVRLPVVVGLLSLGTGLMLLGRMPNETISLYETFPGMLLAGIGIGASYTPLLNAAMGDVAADHIGAASGLINTSYMVGGAIGVMAFGGVAAGRTEALIAAGANTIAALSNGYRVAFELGAAVAFSAAFLSAVVLRNGARS